MKFTINSVLDGKDIAPIIEDCKSQIMKMTPEDIAFPRTVNGITKYRIENDGTFTKGAQAHVKAALTYNQYLKENKITDYPKIEEGNKIRFIWLKEPNVFNSPTFGFINRLPKDEMIEQYIDYETMYQKGFEKPITEGLLEKIGIKYEVSDNDSLDDLF